MCTAAGAVAETRTVRPEAMSGLGLRSDQLLDTKMAKKSSAEPAAPELDAP